MEHEGYGAVGFGDEPLDFSDFVSVTLHGDDGFTRANDPTASALTFDTVSPQDLFLDRTMSAPNSNVFTNLTTPSMYNDSLNDVSPDQLDSGDVSPMFETNDTAGGCNWYPLFDEDDSSAEALRMVQSTSSDSFTSLNLSGNLPDKDDTLRRLSVAAGIAKARRATRTLGPIDVDRDDSSAVKRAKNTMAARKSRQKKRDIEDCLRAALEVMTADRDRWMHIAIHHGAPVPDSSCSP